jgi:hypothetical protein
VFVKTARLEEFNRALLERPDTFIPRAPGVSCSKRF